MNEKTVEPNEEIEEAVEQQTLRTSTKSMFRLAVLAHSTEIKEYVEEHGRKRAAEQGRDFSALDFYMGASAALSWGGEVLYGPAIAWVLAAISHSDPLDAVKENKPHQDTRENEWLVLNLGAPSGPQVIACLQDKDEAYEFAEWLRENTSYRIRVEPAPYFGYVARDYLKYFNAWKKAQEEE